MNEWKKVIRSTRFQALIGVAVIQILVEYLALPTDVAYALYTVFLGHIGVRTVDRFSEKIGSRK